MSTLHCLRTGTDLRNALRRARLGRRDLPATGLEHGVRKRCDQTKLERLNRYERTVFDVLRTVMLSELATLNSPEPEVLRRTGRGFGRVASLEALTG